MRAKTSSQTQKEVAKLYLSKINSREISRKLNISIPTVFRCLERENIKSRTVGESRSFRRIDDTFFEKINTFEKAQILGMIYADGCLYSRSENSHVLSISLQYSDIQYLEQVKLIMKNEAPIQITQNRGFKNGSKQSTFYTCNFKIATDIKKLGITPRKSLTCVFPNKNQVPDEFLAPFILGYFEGDGAFYVNPIGQAVISICCTKEFGQTYADILYKKFGFKCSFSMLNGIDNNMFDVRFKGNLRVIAVMDWLYKNSSESLRLIRKYKAYTEFKEKYLTIKADHQTIEYKKEIQNKIKEQRKKLNGKLNKEFYVKSPDGKIYFSNRVNKFCKEFNLYSKLFSMVLNNQVIQHHNWTLPTSKELEYAKKMNQIINKIYTTQWTKCLNRKKRDPFYQNFYLKDKINNIYLCRSVKSVCNKFRIERYTVERILRIKANTRIGLQLPTNQEIEQAKQNNSIIVLN